MSENNDPIEEAEWETKMLMYSEERGCEADMDPEGCEVYSSVCSSVSSVSCDEDGDGSQQRTQRCPKYEERKKAELVKNVPLSSLGPISVRNYTNAYLQLHRINELFQSLTAVLMIERPPDHLKFIEEKLDVIEKCRASGQNETVASLLSPNREPRLPESKMVIDPLCNNPLYTVSTTGQRNQFFVNSRELTKEDSRATDSQLFDLQTSQLNMEREMEEFRSALSFQGLRDEVTQSASLFDFNEFNELGMHQSRRSASRISIASSINSFAPSMCLLSQEHQSMLTITGSDMYLEQLTHHQKEAKKKAEKRESAS